MNVPPITTTRAAALEPGNARSAATATSPALAVTRAPDPLALSPTAQAARDLAAAPPVDTAKVAALKSQTAAGSYTVDPARIADAMIALDLPGK
ncbi:flagellar biosynthesis anti-sigma factor FlgM [Glacieibacterium frigidum]|uniref:Negative regulator of flagellin synthesis n=1 Tax=Glacieibacterium frigidum TaxID=2593303 RepID=A0A552UEU1_9SPHN|nr:flagellar biosynthesis anti-sigma factor FlgM [Glacieibacterium frigidum]TRW16689.1 flagellar biosynthesis anti-sigma factor FlgM [Glacieibacterium frigidum]